ncbi:phosphopentomutase [bacterium]|nr:MAG: phosphopentomutase [bacterium]
MRAIIIILDGVGIGHAPDADKYGDFGAATLQHTAEKLGGLFWKNLWKLGLSNIFPIEGMTRNMNNLAAFAHMVEKSAGKDSTSGHWELAGLVVDKPFPLYPNGFPDEVIKPFQEAIGRKILWNKPASGTEIIERLGEEHINTGFPIVYTSADSVFQIAAHENVVSVEQLYEWCRIARDILGGEHSVARVIARPFVGEPGNFSRTPNRHDFSLPPFDKTVLDMAKDAGYPVIALGKIFDLYAGQGITEHFPTKDNSDGIQKIIKQIKNKKDGILCANLVDFDMKYGHRRDVIGFASALREFDNSLEKIMESLSDDDILFITADHGTDPTHYGTDHTREQVPLLVYGKKVKPIDLGERMTFADMGATIADILDTEPTRDGISFADDIL